MILSKYLTLDEAIKSPTAKRLGILNMPGEIEIENMRYTAAEIFDPVREHIGGPLFASSFYRSPELNAATPGSSETSQHMTGEAVDIDADAFGNGTNLQIFNFIKDRLKFDQLILEYPDATGRPSWIHCSKRRPPNKNRGQVLVKLRNIPPGFKSSYIPHEKYQTGWI